MAGRTASAGTQPPLHAQMMQIATGHMRTQAIVTAARLGVADRLREGPKSSAELAKEVGAHPRSLYRLLRALAGMGIFAEDAEGRFALTPLGETLRSDTPNSVLAAILLGGSDFHWNSWSNLTRSVRTGQCAFEHVHQMRFFDYLTQHPDAAATFDAWMTRSTELDLPTLLESCRFGDCKIVADVGGGHGILLAAILARHPHLRGILFDLPHVVSSATALRDAALAGRCEVVGGDMFSRIPAGADLYMLKCILHDWSDELSVQILKNCRAAMAGDGRLLVIEAIVPPGNEPHFSKTMDLNMLVLNHGGMERTAEEYRALLEAAGLELVRTIPTASPLSLIEARRA